VANKVAATHEPHPAEPLVAPLQLKSRLNVVALQAVVVHIVHENPSGGHQKFINIAYERDGVIYGQTGHIGGLARPQHPLPSNIAHHWEALSRFIFPLILTDSRFRCVRISPTTGQG
jgi:hypothetical protein